MIPRPERTVDHNSKPGPSSRRDGFNGARYQTLACLANIRGRFATTPCYPWLTPRVMNSQKRVVIYAFECIPGEGTTADGADNLGVNGANPALASAKDEGNMNSCTRAGTRQLKLFLTTDEHR
jgi:hypothetical protein